MGAQKTWKFKFVKEFCNYLTVQDAEITHAQSLLYSSGWGLSALNMNYNISLTGIDD